MPDRCVIFRSLNVANVAKGISLQLNLFLMTREAKQSAEESDGLTLQRLHGTSGSQPRIFGCVLGALYSRIVFSVN